MPISSRSEHLVCACDPRSFITARPRHPHVRTQSVAADRTNSAGEFSGNITVATWRRQVGGWLPLPWHAPMCVCTRWIDVGKGLHV